MVRLANDSQSGRVDQVKVTVNQLGEGGFRTVLGILAQKFLVAEALHSDSSNRRLRNRTVTTRFLSGLSDLSFGMMLLPRCQNILGWGGAFGSRLARSFQYGCVRWTLCEAMMVIERAPWELRFAPDHYSARRWRRVLLEEVRELWWVQFGAKKWQFTEGRFCGEG